MKCEPARQSSRLGVDRVSAPSPERERDLHHPFQRFSARVESGLFECSFTIYVHLRLFHYFSRRLVQRHGLCDHDNEVTDCKLNFKIAASVLSKATIKNKTKPGGSLQVKPMERIR